MYIYLYLSTDLFQGCTGQVRLQHHEAVLLFSQVPHVSIRLPVMQGHRGQVVERRVQIVSHVGWTWAGGKVEIVKEADSVYVLKVYHRTCHKEDLRFRGWHYKSFFPWRMHEPKGPPLEVALIFLMCTSTTKTGWVLKKDWGVGRIALHCKGYTREQLPQNCRLWVKISLFVIFHIYSNTYCSDLTCTKLHIHATALVYLLLVIIICISTYLWYQRFCQRSGLASPPWSAWDHGGQPGHQRIILVIVLAVNQPSR